MARLRLAQRSAQLADVRVVHTRHHSALEQQLRLEAGSRLGLGLGLGLGFGLGLGVCLESWYSCFATMLQQLLFNRNCVIALHNGTKSKHSML